MGCATGSVRCLELARKRSGRRSSRIPITSCFDTGTGCERREN